MKMPNTYNPIQLLSLDKEMWIFSIEKFGEFETEIPNKHNPD